MRDPSSRDNTERHCAACRQTQRVNPMGPPSLPSVFWHTDQMRDALDTWHMGKVLYAYRTHPHHGRPLPQELVAGWFYMTQAQLSRIEKGQAPQDCSKFDPLGRSLAYSGRSVVVQTPQPTPRPRARRAVCESRTFVVGRTPRRRNSQCFGRWNIAVSRHEHAAKRRPPTKKLPAPGR